ncbi:hypothetical protein HSBAA_61810 [Vreelandella sulfidaeris]|uniref:Uncharacterized protein n=1 Tax=Vreelandella sulfidaeris TaxID=115553 RepID=A0A455UFK0_9GAMM|nr:hypothetical protein HSBAA_61810 [Halomonas sulfidaeris]
MNYAYSAIIANTNAYESLNEADRETFATIIGEEASNITEAFLIDEQAQKESQGDAGMTIVEASDAEIVKAQEALAPSGRNGPAKPVLSMNRHCRMCSQRSASD